MVDFKFYSANFFTLEDGGRVEPALPIGHVWFVVVEPGSHPGTMFWLDRLSPCREVVFGGLGAKSMTDTNSRLVTCKNQSD